MRLPTTSAKNFLKFCLENSCYLFIGKIDRWNAHDVAPSGSQNSAANDVFDYNEAIFAKKILDFSLVVRRIDWSERIFDQWNDRDPLMHEKDFYCLTSANHVYKCISNNNRATSTVEPNALTFEPFQTADGYIWRYLFSVPNDDALKFLTPNWIPVKEITTAQTGYENQYASQTAAVPGTIDRIDIINGGSGYDQNDTTITIEGDGTGATASISVHPVSGAINGVTITNRGSNYTWARVVIHDSRPVPGTGAILNPVLSPVRGHGHNPSEELFANHVIATCTIEADEGGHIKGDLSYRKIFIAVNPQLKDNTVANSHRYSNAIAVTLDNISGSFMVGEKVVFSNGYGYIVYIDDDTLHLSSLRGVPAGVVTGETSMASGTVVNLSNTNNFKPDSNIIFRLYFNVRTKALANNIAIKPIFNFAG